MELPFPELWQFGENRIVGHLTATCGIQPVRKQIFCLLQQYLKRERERAGHTWSGPEFKGMTSMIHRIGTPTVGVNASHHAHDREEQLSSLFLRRTWHFQHVNLAVTRMGGPYKRQRIKSGEKQSAGR
jgi:hypothetical protein